MSIHTFSTHVPRDATTAHLTFAHEFITRMRLDERLATEATTPSLSGKSAAAVPDQRGRKVKYAPYTATGIACIIYELVASGRPYTIKEVLDTVWHRYTDAQMAIIGLGEIRTADRMAVLNPPGGSSPTEKVCAINATTAEYQRLWQSIQKLFAAMDDTPLVANYAKASRPTVEQVAAARVKSELVPKTELKHQILNALIASALHVDNDNRRPGTTLHGKDGILEDHEGHLAVDETHLAVGAWGLPKGIAPGNLMATTHAHGKIFKGAPSLIGLSLAVAVARPTQPHDVPNVCLGAAIHHPTGGLGSAVIKIVDAVEAHGLRSPQRSNLNQQVVGDGAYTQAADLNRGLTNRRYGIVIKYKKGQRTLHEVQAVKNDDGTQTPGIRLYNGTALCPGASMAVLTRTHLQVPDFYDRRNDGTPNPLTGNELAAREATLAKVLPFKMSTSGRPQEVEDKKRGGQAKDAPTRAPVMRVTLTCPHVKGTARCAIFSNYQHPDLEHLPPVPAPPTHLPFELRPTCCENASGTMQARIPLQEYKDWQEFMPGTWEHADWYSGPRAANERYNARLKMTTGGSNLNRNTIGPRKAALFALFTAMAIVNANRTSVESWYATLEKNERKNDKSPAAIKPSIKPAPKAHQNKAYRERALNKYLAERTPKDGRRGSDAS